jgi:hypothetical protein
MYLRNMRCVFSLLCVLHAASAAHGKQTPEPRVLRLGSQAPQGVVEAVAVEHGQQRQRFVVGRDLAQVGQQRAPAVGARAVLADAV